MSEIPTHSTGPESSIGRSTKRVVAAFDFDGTLTKGDTFLPFIRFVKGESTFWKGLFFTMPYWAAFAVGLYSNAKAKQKLFSYYFKGMKYDEFRAYGEEFAASFPDSCIRPKAWEALKGHLSRGNRVYIVSASLMGWVEPFFRDLSGVTVLATLAETDPEGKLTGRFRSPNCYGPEKVRRLSACEPVRESYTLYAYGDSKGDKELIELADFGGYNVF